MNETRRSQERRNIAVESRRQAWLWRKEMHEIWNVQLNFVGAKGRENFDANLSEQSVRIIPV